MSEPRPRVVMYATGLCSFCTAARALLERRGVAWEEIRVDADPERRREMEALSGQRTVPQVFIDGRPVGGYQDLRALELAGELDALLAAGRASA